MFHKTVTGTFLIWAFAMFGCSMEHAPLVKQKKPSDALLFSGRDSLSTWALDSLHPVENTVLTNGQVIPVSVHLQATGNANYFVQLSANGKKFGSYKISTLQPPLSQVNASATISWLIKVKGKGKNEDIIVRLYQVEISEAGGTKVTTLMREIQRNFKVICHKKTFFLIRFFKEYVFCTCTPVNS